MLTENKFSKYLIYVIGEVILIVIGILIALKINNWNEQGKKNEEEKALLSGLIQNIDQDIISLKTLRKEDSLYLIANKTLLSAFKIDSIRKNKTFLKLNIIQGAFSSSFNPTQTIFNEMKFSGKIGYISTDSIRNKIQKYYDNSISTLDVLETNEKLIHELSLSIGDYLDLNSTFQLILPEYAKIELNEFDNSFFLEPLESKKVKEFSNLIATRQVLMVLIDESYDNLLQEGIILKQNLIKYLKTK
ncbi:DUF6090 family protein [Aquimarina sp. 2201CG5-10]|uniref:DUF6090 family protein n=1 Tax=Aquimarina callyspongiae TaxID=3098150 RepID=UPI002AB51857|nr:DUF6090 family protein [Aquimarina sp. 2201CG5-10]MDY8134277.1 DUF6090 family protein [Aquimarina sp. 2201CG5-10]